MYTIDHVIKVSQRPRDVKILKIKTLWQGHEGTHLNRPVFCVQNDRNYYYMDVYCVTFKVLQIHVHYILISVESLDFVEPENYYYYDVANW